MSGGEKDKSLTKKWVRENDEKYGPVIISPNFVPTEEPRKEEGKKGKVYSTGDGETSKSNKKGGAE